ncbi:energy-coupling factor transporter transmembrane protein EcfT [bacterium]|nr:energy-coupling factor transporter transmembrane protein EcfT [bacterium]
MMPIAIGQYIPGDSPIHLMDPRTKLITVFAFMISMLNFHELPLLIIYSFFALFIYRLAGLSLIFAWKSIRPLSILIIFTILIHSLGNSGSASQHIPYLNISFTRSGFFSGLFFGVRIINLIMWASLLTLTTAPMAIADGIYRLIRPLKKIGLPAQDLAMMISIALRFIPILFEEALRIHKAQRARGASFSGNIIQRARSILPLLIPLFIATFRRANELAIAMEARCYHSEHPRTSYYTLSFAKLDIIVFISMPAILAPIWILG